MIHSICRHTRLDISPRSDGTNRVVSSGKRYHPHPVGVNPGHGTCQRRNGSGSWFCWAISSSMTTELVLKAFDQAIALRNPPAGLVIHSDRGSQFASEAFRKRLKNHKLVQSMSRRGNCFDNAPMESFFKSYTTEGVSDTLFETHEEASRSAVEYIERFYNRDRLHSSLGYQSPIEFKKTLKTEKRNLPSSEPFVGRSRILASDRRTRDREGGFRPAFVGEFRVAASPFTMSLTLTHCQLFLGNSKVRLNIKDEIL